MRLQDARGDAGADRRSPHRHPSEVGVSLSLLQAATVRLAVAVEAPAHRQRRYLVNARHVLDMAVTSRAAYASMHVNCVVEVNEIRQVVNTIPGDRPVGKIAAPYAFEQWTVVPNLRVTPHADVRRRNSGKPGRLRAPVTVQAGNLIVAHVMSVIELDRLIDRLELTGVPRTTYVEHESQE